MALIFLGEEEDQHSSWTSKINSGSVSHVDIYTITQHI
jgi:hypothetical protein